MTAQDFEREATEQLPTLMAVAMRLSGSRAQAEDLVQEALLKAFKAREQFRAGTNLRAWLLRILRNTFLNAYRRRGLERRVLEGPGGESLSHRALGAASLRAMRSGENDRLKPILEAELGRAIEELPADFRMTVTLADVEELSYREIAEAMDCPVGTVMSRLHRGRRMLRQRLTDQALALGILPESEAGDSRRAPKKDAEPTPGRQAVSLSEYRRREGSGAS